MLYDNDSGAAVLSDRDRRVLLLLEQQARIEDPRWVARCERSASGRAPRRSLSMIWRPLTWCALGGGLSLVAVGSSAWILSLGLYLAGGAVIVLFTAAH